MKRRILILGGTGEIGVALARRFASNGDSVLVAGDRPPAPGTLPETVKIRSVDVRDIGATRDLVRIAVSELGGLDVFVWAVGIVHECPVLEESDARWRDTFAVNVDAAFAAGQEAASVMARVSTGVMLFISSTDGYAPSPGYAAYAASKAALLSLAKSLANEMGRSGVRVVALCPGHIDTELSRTSGSPEYQRWVIERTALGRAGSVEEVAATAAFLCSGEASYVTGTALVVDGGQLGRW